MVCFVVWAVLSMEVLHPAAGEATRASRDPGGEQVPGIQQDTSRASGHRLPVALAPVIGQGATLELLLSGRGTRTDVAAIVESLLTQYPQLRSLLLREFLLPSDVDAKDQFARQIQQMAKLSRFQQMSLAARRYREIFQYDPTCTLLVPEVNIIRIIEWLVVRLISLWM